MNKYKIFEVKENIITIKIDTNLIKKFNRQKEKDKKYGDMNDIIIEKAKNGNITYIKKCIDKLSDSSLILLTLIVKGEFQKRLEKEKNNDKMNLVC